MNMSNYYEIWNDPELWLPLLVVVFILFITTAGLSGALTQIKTLSSQVAKTEKDVQCLQDERRGRSEYRALKTRVRKWYVMCQRGPHKAHFDNSLIETVVDPHMTMADFTRLKLWASKFAKIGYIFELRWDGYYCPGRQVAIGDIYMTLTTRVVDNDKTVSKTDDVAENVD